MKKIGLAIREVHRSEGSLARELLRLSDRHRTDHEIHHLGRDLARWSGQHVAELARVGRDYGLDLDPEVDGYVLPRRTQRKAARWAGRRPEPSMLLLVDLRRLYRAASGVSLDWEILAQAAQARKEPGLLAIAKRCHPETLRQARWANTKLKETSAQALAT